MRNIIIIFLLFVATLSIHAGSYVSVDNPSLARRQLTDAPEGSLLDIKCDVDMGEVWRLKPHCTLRYSGGKVKAGVIEGDQTVISAPSAHFIQADSVCGSWRVDVAYPEWFGAREDHDCSKAIDLAMGLHASEVRFSKGVYAITRPVVTKGSDIYLAGGATLRAQNEMETNIRYRGKTYTVHAMVVGDYRYPGAKDVYGLHPLPRISGGGCIDGNYRASVGIQLHQGFRTVIRDLTIKNVLSYGLVTSTVPGVSGNCFVENCMFQNTDNYDTDLSSVTVHHPEAVAILNNRNDCVYSNIEIVNFQTAVRHTAPNAVFTNLHAWLRDPFYWDNSVVFDCFSPDITLNGCEADTMRKLLKSHNTGFFATVMNCKAYNNTDIVSDKMAARSMPVVVEKYDDADSHVVVTGGSFWFETPYSIINRPSVNDRVESCRYNVRQVR